MLAGGYQSAICALDNTIAHDLPPSIKEIGNLTAGVKDFGFDNFAAMFAFVIIDHLFHLAAAKRAYFILLFLIHRYPMVNLFENITMLAIRAVSGRTPQNVVPAK